MIWRLAGTVGIDPSPFTLRELLWMAHGAWQPTSHLLATLANANRDPKKHPTPIQPRDCNPFERQRASGRGIKIHKGNIGLLKFMVGGGEKDRGEHFV